MVIKVRDLNYIPRSFQRPFVLSLIIFRVMITYLAQEYLSLQYRALGTAFILDTRFVERACDQGIIA